MSKNNKKHLRKYAALSLAAMLAINPIMHTQMVYATEEEEPVQVDPNQTIDEENKTDDSSIANELLNQSATISDDAVYQIRIGYEFDDGSFDEWAKGSAFLVNDKYLLTSQTFSDLTCNSALYSRIVESKADIYKRVGITLTDAETTEKHIRIYITNTNGEKIEYQNTISKNGVGVIILSKAVTTPVCVFASEGKIDFNADDAINLKFTGKDDSKAIVQTSKGTVFVPEDVNASSSGFYFKADTSNGNALGAPIYDTNGNITAMVFSTYNEDDDSFAAVDQSVLQTFLSTNGISYKTQAQVEEEQKIAQEEQNRNELEAAQESVTESKKLEEAIKNAQDINRKDYTEESLQELDAAVEEGETILETTVKTQAQVDAAAKNINDKLNTLVEKNLLEKVLSGGIVIIVGGAALILLILSTLIKIIFGKGKHKKVKVDKKGTSTPVEDDYSYEYSEELRRMEEEDLRERANENAERIKKAKEERAKEEAEARRTRKTAATKKATQAKKDFFTDFDDEFDDFDENVDVTTRVKPKADRIPGNASQKGIIYAEGYDDDNVAILDEDGEEDTTVLENRRPKGYLVRLDNGKRIDITKDDFMIGKERKKVDYCISGDPSVSRIHARVRMISGGFYIEDQDSTNYTFVNDNQIPAYKAVYIQDGSLIRLSDVEFEFHEK